LLLSAAAFAPSVAASAPATQKVGYYDMCDGMGADPQIAPIETAGFTAVNISNPTAAQLSNVSILFVDNCDNSAYGAEYLAHLGAISTFVSNGGRLIIHDRFVTNAATILPGGGAIAFHRDFSDDANVDILDWHSIAVNGPGGMLDNSSLDNGNSSSHGFADAGTLPAGSRAVLSRTNPSQVVTFSYCLGNGGVTYSTIPLDFYLAGSNPAAFRNLYAPNVVAYGASVCTPDLQITKTHSGKLSHDVQKTYTIVVSNYGDLKTNGMVTVTDTASAGLLLQSLSGNGWTCNATSCWRSDRLNPGQSYPPIKAAVAVIASNGNVNNTATVSGGNEYWTGNDKAVDASTIGQ